MKPHEDPRLAAWRGVVEHLSDGPRRPSHARQVPVSYAPERHRRRLACTLPSVAQRPSGHGASASCITAARVPADTAVTIGGGTATTTRSWPRNVRRSVTTRRELSAALFRCGDRRATASTRRPSCSANFDRDQLACRRPGDSPVAATLGGHAAAFERPGRVCARCPGPPRSGPREVQEAHVDLVRVASRNELKKRSNASTTPLRVDAVRANPRRVPSVSPGCLPESGAVQGASVRQRCATCRPERVSDLREDRAGSTGSGGMSPQRCRWPVVARDLGSLLM